MPKGKPYHDKSAKKAEKKDKDEKPEMKFAKGLKKGSARRMSA